MPIIVWEDSVEYLKDYFFNGSPYQKRWANNALKKRWKRKDDPEQTALNDFFNNPYQEKYEF